MKKMDVFGTVREDKYELRYMSGVPSAERKRFWPRSPWDALRLLLRGA